MRRSAIRKANSWLRRNPTALELEYAAKLAQFSKEINEYHRTYVARDRVNNPEHNRALLRKSYHKHAERRRADAKYQRQRIKTDPTRLAQSRAWSRNRNRRMMADPKSSYPTRRRISTRIFMALRRVGTEKSLSTIELVGCSMEQLRNHIEAQFKPGMSWENHCRHGWHLDHKTPCVAFDLTKVEEQKKCFHYTNLQPLWAAENLSKGDRIAA